MKKNFMVLGAFMITAACTLLTPAHADLPASAAYARAAVSLTDEGTCGDAATYTYANGVLTISGTGSIDERAFNELTQIQRVVINKGITEIGNEAFSQCTNLTQITIPDSVTVIGSGVFASTRLTSLTMPPALTRLGACILEENTGVKEITIPKTIVTTYDNWGGDHGAFWGSAVETVSFEDGLKTIPKMACHGAASLTSVSIPNSVTTIDSEAFCECTALTQISIPVSVTTIESGAFARSGLTSLTMPPALNRLGACILEENTGVKEITIPKTIVYMHENWGGNHGAFWGSAVETVTFENELKTIPKMACHGAASLTSVSIPDSVTTIDSEAFSECTNLAEISIPDSVTVIESAAFAFSGLTSLTLPPAITKLGAFILEENTGVKEITIPKTIVYMHENWGGNHGAFCGSAVETVTFENGLKTIPKMACHGAASLTSVSIPDSVTTIGSEAFSECTNLAEISIPDSVTAIESGTFARSGLTSLTLPPAITRLGACILEENTGVREITIPKTIVYMHDNYGGNHGAFYGSAVEILTFADDIKTIPQMACHGMKKVTTVVIPVSVTRFEEEVFEEVGDDIVVYAYTGSYAMAYAQKLGIPTKSIGQCIASVITASNITRTASKNVIVVSLNAKTNSKGILSYRSNNRYVTVNPAGTVTIAKNFAGTAKITITVNQVREYLSASKVVTITVKPASVKLKKLKKLKTKKKSKGQMTVTWAKNTASTGFEVQYATNRKFTKNVKKVNVKGSGKTSTTLKSLKKKKTYYVRVRTYKTTADGKLVSGWSNVKKIKM